MRQLEKYAVSMGGGHNHRMGLYDEVLVKDNHIDAAGSVTAAVQAVLASPAARDLPIVVEVRTLDELAEALRLPVTRVLLDNMNEAQLRAAVTLSDGRVPLEASGNMTLDRVRVVAETGVQYISVGALTHSAPALDLSMRLALID
jgi:nicotinate-nucleotide pyrophosphorylase (carboxylating)